MSDRYAAQPFASSYPPARHRPNTEHHPVESGVTAFPVTPAIADLEPRRGLDVAVQVSLTSAGTAVHLARERGSQT